MSSPGQRFNRANNAGYQAGYVSADHVGFCTIMQVFLGLNSTETVVYLFLNLTLTYTKIKSLSAVCVIHGRSPFKKVHPPFSKSTSEVRNLNHQNSE